MTRTMYHGSNHKFDILHAGSYITPEIETAREFGNIIYQLQVVCDEDETFEMNGRMFLSGNVIKGTATRVQTQPWEGFRYARTHEQIAVTVIE